MAPDKLKKEAEKKIARSPSVDETRPKAATDGRPSSARQTRSHEGAGAAGRAESERMRQQQVGNTQLLVSSSQTAGQTPDLQRRAQSGAGPAGLVSEERLNEIEAAYRAMISDSRRQGYNIAADNLQRFLDGTGGTKTLTVTWLRGFDAIVSAERANQERFESSLTDLAYTVPDGGSRRFNDYWDKMLTASQATELYYASGTSSIKSTGSFTLARSGKQITITGTVDHHWYDPYDWHAGLGVYVPGHGFISDEDGLLMQRHRGARPFHMEADWTQTVSGSVEIVDYWFDNVNYNWAGP